MSELAVSTSPEVPLQIITPELVRASIKRARKSLEAAAEEIIWQIEMEGWRTLGYSSWGAMREHEYGGAAFMVPGKNRPEIVERIKAIEVGRTARGNAKYLTNKEIAETVGVSLAQVERDLKPENKNPQMRDFVNEDIIDAEIIEVTSAPKTKRRRPITDQAGDAGWELRKATEKLQRIFEDDRLGRNKEEVATHLRGHLMYAVETLQGFLDTINDK